MGGTSRQQGSQRPGGRRLLALEGAWPSRRKIVSVAVFVPPGEPLTP